MAIIQSDHNIKMLFDQQYYKLLFPDLTEPKCSTDIRFLSSVMYSISVNHSHHVYPAQTMPELIDQTLQMFRDLLGPLAEPFIQCYLSACYMYFRDSTFTNEYFAQCMEEMSLVREIIE